MPIPANSLAALRRVSAWHAAVFYTAAVIWWTWPLASVMSTSIAWDLGDPLLVAWVMGWVNDSILALFRGDMGRFMQLWDAPIFHPQPLTIAYSDHLITQSLLTLPVYAVTGNVILCYNLALLASFVLSGVGMFLLTRELTGSAAAGVLCGAVYAFTPYRVDQMSHLAILSSQWMPLALYGFRRYFAAASDPARAARRLRPLMWGTLALVAHNHSSGYLMLFFAPFMAAYVIGEMCGRRLVRSGRTWMEVGGAGAATAVLTVPFLLPYIAVSDTVGRRAYETIREFSADVYAYATAPGYVRWLADRLSYMREAPENSTFPGVVISVLAVTALAVLVVQRVRAWRQAPTRDGWRTAAAALFIVIAAFSAGMAVWIMLTGGRIVIIAGQEVRLRNLARFTVYGSVAFTMAVLVSARVRHALRGAPGSLLAGSLALAFVAFLLSLGPRMETMNEFIGTGPYSLLLQTVPGFAGLRVPSRYAMIVVMWMAVAAAYAAAPLARRRWGLAVVALLSIGAVVESRPAPFDIDAPLYEPDVAPITMTHRLRLAEPLYQKLAESPRGVLLELPWGTTGWDLQYMQAQRRHGWPLVNGFSGHYPDTYMRTSMIKDALTSPERAWWALERSGASHVIVHEWAFPSIERGRRVSQWLRDNGAVEVAATENDVLFRLPGGIRHR